MKNLKNVFVSFVLVTALIISFISCDLMFKPSVDIAGDNNIENLPDVNLNYNVDDFSTAFGKAVFLTAKVNNDAINLLKDTGVDVEAVGHAARSAKSDFGLYDLGKYISSYSRNIGEDGNTLEADFDTLTKTYNESVLSLVPSFDDALAFELITVEDGEILLWGQRIAVDSIEGIATIEIMNMVAAGIDIEEAVVILQEDIEKILVDNQAGRGCYIKPENAINDGKVWFKYKWTNGVVKYRFVTGDIPWETKTKKNATDAMDEWKNRSGEEVKFEEIKPDEWAKFCNGIGQYSWVDISIKNLNGLAGQATAGAAFSTTKDSGYLRIAPEAINNMPTYRHELGHTLGLMHEHQRPDRDKWVKVTGKGYDFDKLPDELFVLAVKKVTVLFVTIYLPYVWCMEYGVMVNDSKGNYDFESIMGYDSFILENKIYKKDGTSFRTPGTISDTDVKTIKKIY